MTLCEQMLAEIQTEFPRFRLVPKQGDRLSHLIAWLLRVVTLGGQRSYLEKYHTVLGWTLYLPNAWTSASDVERAIVLRHERIHLRQQRRYGRLLMAFLYLVPFFPVGLAYGRARLEWEAYEETLRATAEYRGLDAVHDPALRRQLIARFTGGDYGYMWPFAGQVNRWLDRSLDALERQCRGR